MKKGKLLRITAIFFVFMFCFTILSRAADQAGIAMVSAERPENRMISHDIKATGKVVQNQELAVTTEANQRVKAIYVSEGDRIASGDLLFEVDTVLLEEQILEQQQEMEKQALQVKDAKSQKDVSAQQKASQQAQAQEQYSLTTYSAGVRLSRAKKALENAKNELEKFRKKRGVSKEDSSVEASLMKICEEKAEAYIEAEQKLSQLQWKIENEVYIAQQNAGSGAVLTKNGAVHTQEADLEDQGELLDIINMEEMEDVQDPIAVSGGEDMPEALDAGNPAESLDISDSEAFIETVPLPSEPMETDPILPQDNSSGSLYPENSGTVSSPAGDADLELDLIIPEESYDNTAVSGGNGSGTAADTGISGSTDTVGGEIPGSGDQTDSGISGNTDAGEITGDTDIIGEGAAGDGDNADGASEDMNTAGGTTGDADNLGGGAAGNTDTTEGGTTEGADNLGGGAAGNTDMTEGGTTGNTDMSGGGMSGNGGYTAPSQEDLERIEESVRDSYSQELKTARANVEAALEAKNEAAAALAQYQEERLAALKTENAVSEKQLIANVQAAQQVYEDAAIAANEAAVTSGRAVQQAGIPDASNSSDRMNEITYEQMELRLEKLENLKEAKGKIYALSDGLVTKINIITGEKTTDTTAILMADLSKGYRFSADITKDQEQYIGTGDLVTLTGGKKQKLEELPVESVTADENDDNIYHVIVQIPDDTLEIGMTATLEFSKKSEAYPICVPLTALHLDEKNQPYVLVPDEYETIMGTELKARKVSVTVLEKNESYAALSEGTLTSQQQVIISSDKAVDEGSRVRISS